MKFTSGFIQQASGSVGGFTYSRNRYGGYIRAKVTPIDPNSAYQQAQRQRLSELAERWRNVLTSVQRAAWQVYADNTPVNDKLGHSQILTGLNWYVACNSLRLLAGLAIVDAAPETFGLCEFTAPTFTADESEGKVKAAFTNTDDWAGEVGGAMLMFASSPKAPSINFFKGPYVYCGMVAGAVVPPTSPGSKSPANPGFEGQQVFMKTVFLRADGRISIPFRGACIIAA